MYISVHTLILLIQSVALNVAVNSNNNVLLTLLVSNNFVELKGSVFKKCEKQNLFQISCAPPPPRNPARTSARKSV